MTRREWIGALVIGALVIAAEAYVLPKAMHWPDIVPPHIARRFRARPPAPADGIVAPSMTWALVGVAIFVVGVMLYCWWAFRPLAIRFTEPKPIPVGEPPPDPETPERE